MGQNNNGDGDPDRNKWKELTEFSKENNESDTNNVYSTISKTLNNESNKESNKSSASDEDNSVSTCAIPI